MATERAFGPGGSLRDGSAAITGLLLGLTLPASFPLWMAFLGDTVAIGITIRDVDSDIGSFNPPNIITPNGDNCNDYFAMEGVDPVGGTLCPADDPDDSSRGLWRSGARPLLCRCCGD